MDCLNFHASLLTIFLYSAWLLFKVQMLKELNKISDAKKLLIKNSKNVILQNLKKKP